MTLCLVCGYWVSISDHTVYNDLLLCNPTLQPFINLSHIYCLISAVCCLPSEICLVSGVWWVGQPLSPYFRPHPCRECKWNLIGKVTRLVINRDMAGKGLGPETLLTEWSDHRPLTDPNVFCLIKLQGTQGWWKEINPRSFHFFLASTWLLFCVADLFFFAK